MSSASIHDAATDLAWSLWTEVGVPGVVRRHSNIVIDPEPLLVHSPLFACSDPRLLGLIYTWCTTFHDRISTSRLQGLLAVAPMSVTGTFAAMAATLKAHSSVHWPVAEGGVPWPESPEIRHVSIDLARPSLLRLRLRALLGVGARADVMCELLADREGWLSASDLESLGYTKRNVARILSELHQARFVDSRADGNILRFRLTRAEDIASIAGSTGLSQPRWKEIFALVVAAIDLSAFESRSPALRRVEAHKSREATKALADRLWLESPPETKSRPGAWEEMLGWFTAQLLALADGTSKALSRR